MTTNLLVFFAIPLAVIIFSIALQKILRNPLLVAAIIFAIFIVVTFIVEDTETFLIATIIYTIISFVTAILFKLIRRIIRILNREEDNEDEEDDGCGRLNETLDVNSTLFQNSNTNGRVENYYRYNRR